jgi:hypothetical protein
MLTAPPTRPPVQVAPLSVPWRPLPLESSALVPETLSKA